ncbi:hypothetical protein B4168_3028 [Anoxybacillus flavithermus]|nr:hypothetical protein B4168_3028 [Anoxybacillus flavithermus]OAO86317.1 hypothetical protein GT23_2210 [Parageobacillus thermoglucosidasius]
MPALFMLPFLHYLCASVQAAEKSMNLAGRFNNMGNGPEGYVERI